MQKNELTLRQSVTSVASKQPTIRIKLKDVKTAQPTQTINLTSKIKTLIAIKSPVKYIISIWIKLKETVIINRTHVIIITFAIVNKELTIELT